MTGTTISHYQIERELGRGGMGVVYKARDTRLNRTVAIKVLPAHALASEDDRARFYREAQAAAALSHANIATVYEIDESLVIPTDGGTSPGQAAGSGEPQPFIAMEFVEGESLADRIAKGPLPLKEAISIAKEIADGLHAAHTKSIVHRDIKSGNVMLTADGQAKILDFGLAKTAASTRLTNLGSTLGTIAYMSPEQARGEEVDRRTDIWSLGAVLYEMITGRMPFPGDYEQAVVYGILNEEPEPPTALRTGVPMELERIVAKCLAKDAARRYQHADELAVDLDSVDIRPSGLSTIAPAVVIPAGPRSSSLSLPVVVALVVAAAALSGLTAILLRPRLEAPRVSRQHLLVDQKWPYEPALSPDGRLLAFGGYDSRSKSWGLHIYDFETGDVVTVPDLIPRLPMFSADGSRIAFYWSNKVMSVSVRGGAPAVDVPDGVGFGFTLGSDGGIFFRGGRDILLVERAGEAPRVFATQDSSLGEVAMYPYQVLPGGRHLLAGITRGSPERDDLVAIDVRTGESRDLLPDAGYAAAYTPSDHLVYITESDGPLYVRSFDPEELEVTGPPVQASPSVRDRDWTFSRSGRFANVVRSEPRERLLRVGSDGSVNVLPVDTMNFGAFRVSPSGRYSVLTAYSEGKSTMFIYDNVSSTQLRLALEGTEHNTPAWSPDEKRIVYSSKLETTNRIYVSRADGSGSPDLLVRTPSHAYSPDWSPDGMHVVYFREEGDLWIYSFADSTARPMAPRINEKGRQERPRFSPDGQYLTYISNESGEYELFVARVDGTAKWRITSGEVWPVWSTDQSRIFVRKGSAIHEIRVETSPGFRILGERAVYSSDRKISWFDALPGDRGFVVSEQIEADTRHFEIVDNWFQYLEQIAPHSD